jgi:hypothetical protein
MSRVHCLLRPGATHDGIVSLTQGAYSDQGASYLSGNISTSCLNRVDAFARQHPCLLDALFTLTAAQQIAEVADWQALARRDGSWIYGYVELQIRRYGHSTMSARDWQPELDEELARHADPTARCDHTLPLSEASGNFSVASC